MSAKDATIRDVRVSEIEAGQDWLFDGSWVRVLDVEPSPHPDDRVIVGYDSDGERATYGGYLGHQRAAVRGEVSHSAPQAGDRVTVPVTGTVLEVAAHSGPNLRIELDSDLVSTGTACSECGPAVDCDDITHPGREQVVTFAAPAEVAVIERAGGGVR